MASTDAGPPPRSAPAPRPWLAAAVGLVALLAAGAPLRGPLSTYALGLPILAACATWLAGITGRGSPALARLAAAALLLAPAAGLRSTRVAIDSFELAYVPAEQVLYHLLRSASATSTGVAMLLLAGGLAGAAGLGRAALPASGAALGGAAGAGLAAWALRDAAEAWWGGQPIDATRLAAASDWTGLLALPGALAGLLLARARSLQAAPPPPAPPPNLRRAPALLTVLVLLTSAWLATPPVRAIAAALPAAPAPAARVQALPAGRAFAAPTLQAVDLADPDRLDRRLAARKLHRLRPGWPCSPLPPLAWADDLRNVVQLALPPQLTIGELEPALIRLTEWGVYDIVLLGRGPPQPGRLGDYSSWPGTSLLLDRPARGVRWLAADARGWQVVEEAPWFGEGPAVCALLVTPSLTVGELTLLARQLSEPGGGGPCQDALALVLPAWDAATAGQPAPTGCDDTPARGTAAGGAW